MVPGISLAAYWDWGWGEALYMYESWREVEAQVGCFLGCATWLVAQALGYVHVTPPPCSRQLDLGRVLQRPHSRGGPPQPDGSSAPARGEGEPWNDRRRRYATA